ncbi:MAG: hypothetical protein FJW66_01980 [Actinobacteria bacterium]|nr:hypothetical protein [Actinomycetota bacterium]
MSAARIRDLTGELGIKTRQIFLIINRTCGKLDERLENLVCKSGFEILGTVDNDDAIINLELDGKNIFDLDPESSSILQIRNILQELNL